MRTTNLLLLGFLLIVYTRSSPIRKREESSVTTSRTPDLEHITSSGIQNRTVSKRFTTLRAPISATESSENFKNGKKDEKKKKEKKKRIPNHGETFDWASFNEKESPTKLSLERNYLVTVVFVFYLCAFFL